MNFGDVTREWSRLWLPPRRLQLAEWAEKNFVLSSDYAPSSGELRLYGWQREIFDSFTDPSVNKIVLKVGTQLVKTLFMQCALAYVMAEVPGPALFLQPDNDAAKTFSKERLAPMLRDIPALNGLVPQGKRDSKSTLTYKAFPGGNLAVLGARTPGNLARRTIRYLFADEINKYKRSVANEGSPLPLAEERVANFGSRKKVVYACSPTVEKAPISLEYEASDQRQPWCKCWSCGEMQVLKWAQVRWDSSVARELLPATARYYCEHCNKPWNDLQRREAADQAIWVASKPFTGTAGFWISHLYSSNKTIEEMVRNFLKITAANDSGELQVFVNTNLAEEWKDKGETPEWRRLRDRAEPYETGTVPTGVLFLTAAVDVQADRLEFEVKGWGRGRENWSITYEIIQPVKSGPSGRPVPTRTSEPECWDILADLIRTQWPCEGGGTMQIWCTAIDTGYSPQYVYDFCHRFPQPAHGPAGSRVHSYLTVVPVKGGDSSHKLIESVSDADAASKRKGLKIVKIGTHSAKQEIYDSLRLDRMRNSTGAGHCHHPEQYDEQYFKGLTAESRFVKDNGDVEWRRDGRNEPLDLAVYNRAAAELCGISRFGETEWRWFEQLREEMSRPVETPGSADADTVVARPRYVERKNWFSAAQ